MTSTDNELDNEKNTGRLDETRERKGYWVLLEFHYLTWNTLQIYHTLTLNPKSKTDPNHNPNHVAYFPCEVVKLQERRLLY